MTRPAAAHDPVEARIEADEEDAPAKNPARCGDCRYDDRPDYLERGYRTLDFRRRNDISR